MHCHNQTFAETVFLQKEKVGGYSLAVLFFNFGLPKEEPNTDQNHAKVKHALDPHPQSLATSPLQKGLHHRLE